METQKGPIKTNVLLKGGCMGFHVSLGECSVWGSELRVKGSGLSFVCKETVSEEAWETFNNLSKGGGVGFG